MIALPPSVAAFAARLSLSGIAIAVLAGLLAVQTVRLEGFKFWPLSWEGWKPKAERLDSVIDGIVQAETTARIRAEQARQETERKYAELAERTDREAHIAQEAALDAAERFIAANRVRCAPDRSAASAAVAPASSDSAGSGDGPGGTSELDEVSLVAVPDEDVRICTRNTNRLIAAREWGLELQGD